MSAAILTCPACAAKAVLQEEFLQLAQRIAAGQEPAKMLHLCPECGAVLVYEAASARMRHVPGDELACIPVPMLRGMRIQLAQLHAARRSAAVGAICGCWRGGEAALRAPGGAAIARSGDQTANLRKWGAAAGGAIANHRFQRQFQKTQHP
jgi:hypothetical protein